MNVYEFEKTVFDRIRKDNMLKDVSNVVVGFSGGSDSVALLHVLNKYKDKYNIKICAVHINHNIRGDEAKRDEAFAEEYCKKNGIDFKGFSLDVMGYAKVQKISDEEAGRSLRYQKFEEAAGKLGREKTVIAVAHNSDDNAETVLFNIFRGSGVKGLSGIKAKRDNIIRPLIDISKKDIEKYLEDEGENFVVDSTNLHNDYARNVIRNEILPLVSDNINANVSGAVNRLSAMAEEVSDFIEKYAESLYDAYVCKKNNREDVCIEIKKEIAKVHKVVRLEIYRMSFKAVAKRLKDVSNEHMEMIDNLFLKQVGSLINLPYDVIAHREYSGVIIEKKDKCGIKCNENQDNEEVNADISYEIIDDKEKINEIIEKSIYEFAKNSENKYTKYLDYDKIKGEFCLRKRRSGDYLIINEKGNTKKIKDIFTDMKIPRDQRDKTLLLCDEAGVLWIVGIRGSAHINVDKNTKKILKVDVTVR